MKILHICPSFWPNIGGVERFILDLATRSRAAGAEVSVLTLTAGETGRARLPSRDRVADIPVRRVPFLDLRYYKPSLLPLSDLRAADILHVHNVGAMLDFTVATRWIHRRPIVVSTHGGIFHTATLSPLKKAYFFGVEAQVARGVDRFVADSHPDLELFHRISSRVSLIEIGVDLDTLSSLPMRNRSPTRYVYVGRIARSKRIDSLLHAFAQVHRRGGEFDLHIVGPDWEGIQSELEALAEALQIGGRVRFTGAVSDEQLRSELAQATFFVSASQYEGFGISVIEAMGAGCVPILNRIDAFEHFVDPPHNGLLVDFTDSGSAASQILALSPAAAPAMAARARESVARFAWSEKIVEWMRLYRAVSPGA